MALPAGVGWGTETLQQLVLVLSDGRLSEKATLRRAVREAAERAGVMLAFIILDNREPGNSVLDTKSVRRSVSPGGRGKDIRAASRQLRVRPGRPNLSVALVRVHVLSDGPSMDSL